jgi:hypothetical protein
MLEDEYEPSIIGTMMVAIVLVLIIVGIVLFG